MYICRLEKLENGVLNMRLRSSPTLFYIIFMGTPFAMKKENIHLDAFIYSHVGGLEPCTFVITWYMNMDRKRPVRNFPDIMIPY